MIVMVFDEIRIVVGGGCVAGVAVGVGGVTAGVVVGVGVVVCVVG